MLPADEQELLDRFHTPSSRETAFTELVKQYQEQLYAAIFRMLSDEETTKDVLQNVFIKVWKHLGQFRGDAKLSTWIYRIAINEALNWLEQEKKRALAPMAETMDTKHAQVNREYSADQIERKLEEAIRSLPAKQRTVFLLRYYDEMPYEEMSKVLETSEGALKASYHHAVKKIQSSLLHH